MTSAMEYVDYRLIFDADGITGRLWLCVQNDTSDGKRETISRARRQLGERYVGHPCREQIVDSLREAILSV